MKKKCGLRVLVYKLGFLHCQYRRRFKSAVSFFSSSFSTLFVLLVGVIACSGGFSGDYAFNELKYAVLTGCMRVPLFSY